MHEVTGRPDQVAKIYHPSARTAERRVKLETMLARAPRDPTAHRGHPSLAWPQELLFSGGAFCGFLMPLVPPGARTALCFLQPEDRRRAYPEFHFRYLLTAGRNLASAIAAVHQVGACVGDLNESNVMVTPSALVTLIDCDSFQVGRHRCPVGKPEYLAPELIGRTLAQVDRTPEGDAFALAVLLFQLLMQGFHPFSGRWQGAGDPPDVGRRIQGAMYAYGGRPEISPPPAAPSTAVLPRPVRSAFDEAFGPGVGDPARRPSARDWVGLLDDAAHTLRACATRPAQHLYPRHLRACPWCALAARGLDYFPETVGDQVELPAARPAPASRPQAAAGPPPAPPASRPEAPRLLLEPAHLAFTGLVRGTPARTATVTVRNVGRAEFRGRAEIDPPGLAVAVQPQELYLSPFHGENEARMTVRVDPGNLWWAERRTHVIRLTGGGHEASLRVVVAAAEQTVAAAAVRRAVLWGAWAAAAVAAALLVWGAVRSSLVPPLGRALDAALFAAGAPLRPAAVWLWCALLLVRLPALLRARRREERLLPAATLVTIALLPPLAEGAMRAGAFAVAVALAGVPAAAAAARALARSTSRRLNGWVARSGAGFLAKAAIAAGLAIAGPATALAATEGAVHLPAPAMALLASIPPPAAALGLGGLPPGVPADAALIRLPAAAAPWTVTADAPVTAVLLAPGTRYHPGDAAPTALPVTFAAYLPGQWRYAVLTAAHPAQVTIGEETVTVYPRRPVVLRRG